jgi:type I restriction enzyme R subunit
MPDSNFTFLQSEWPAWHDAASKAESFAHPDARTACFYAPRGLEVIAHWLYKPLLERLITQENLKESWP